MRVVFAHNYDMRLAQDLVATGRYPAQHLYGMSTVRSTGAEVQILPLDRWPWLRRFSRSLGWRLGDLGQEVQALRASAESTVHYSGELHGLAGLALLRGVGATGAPLVAVLHQPVPATRRMSAVLRGVDIAICLSRAVQRQVLADHARTEESTRCARWGPDLDYPGYEQPVDGGYVISTGKTERDLPLLFSALERIDVPARVYALDPQTGPVGAGTTVVSPRGPDDYFAGMPHFPADRVIDDIRGSAVVAIPLSRTDRMVGLTEIADALALGKPLVVTRSPFLDIDIEEIGCGRWVEPGDRDGWSSALGELMADERLRAEMGAAGRAFAEASCNERLFGLEIRRALADALADRPGRP